MPSCELIAFAQALVPSWRLVPSLGEARCIFRFFETQSERARRRQGGGSIDVNKGRFLQSSPVTPLIFGTSHSNIAGRNSEMLPNKPVFEC